MNAQIGKPVIRLVLAGARSPAISGSCMTMREMERAFTTDESIGSTIVDLAGIRRRGLTGIFRYASRLLEVFRGACRSDAVFLFTIGSGLPWTLIPMWLISVLTRTCLIVRCGGGTAHGHGSRFRQRLVKMLLRRASLYIVQTELLCEHARSIGITQVVSIPNGRDLSKAIRASHPYRGRWIFVSRLVPMKGVLESIEAFRQMPELSLDLVGPSDLDRVGEDKGVDMKSLSLPSNVTWLGAREPAEIPALLAEYDGLVFPSYYSTEGHAGVLIEAMAAGLPIVTTRHRSIPEVVDETCGILIEVRDVKGIVDAVSRLDEDSELRDQLGSGSVIRSREFDWAVLSERCKRLVIKAVESRRQ